MMNDEPNHSSFILAQVLDLFIIHHSSFIIEFHVIA